MIWAFENERNTKVKLNVLHSRRLLGPRAISQQFSILSIVNQTFAQPQTKSYNESSFDVSNINRRSVNQLQLRMTSLLKGWELWKMCVKNVCEKCMWKSVKKSAKVREKREKVWKTKNFKIFFVICNRLCSSADLTSTRGFSTHLWFKLRFF
jgi:hypothetical protein